MSMLLQLQFAALLGFAALMVLAALEDLRRLMIPNALTLALCVLWPLYVLATPTLIATLGSLACAAIVFLVGALLFSRGYIGGGDVKLLTVAVLWAGPGGVGPLLLLTGVLGGMLALFLLIPPGAHLASLARAKFGPGDASIKGGLVTPVPYGIAIAAAAVIVIFVPHFR
jgi:prepilin peptidase CpaA